MAETQLVSAIITYLKSRGFYAVRVQSGRAVQKRGKFTSWIHLAPAGTPDILASVGGRFVAIEAKRDAATRRIWDRQYERYEKQRLWSPSAQTSIDQHAVHEKIRQGGGIVLVCSSLDEVAKEIDGILDVGKKRE